MAQEGGLGYSQRPLLLLASYLQKVIFLKGNIQSPPVFANRFLTLYCVSWYVNISVQFAS